MQTRIALRVRSPAERIFELAARVEDWPRLLPHYRWVRVLDEQSTQERVVEMAASRQVVGPLAIPLWWRSIQRVDRIRNVVEFEHIAGITCGMSVQWAFKSNGHATEVSISHRFAPAWPVPDPLVQLVVGEYFVNGVARRTLQRLGEYAEAPKSRR